MRILLLIVLACTPETAWADYIIGPREVNDSLKTMTLMLRQTKEATSTNAKADALAKLAQEANYLTSLINLEIRSHGLEQKPLIELALRRCEELGVAISYDYKKELYFYDQRAYAEYLRLNPSGPHDREARFMVVERKFYTQTSDDLPGITQLVGEIEQFLARYPHEERRSEIELFLVVLHRDLYRIKISDPDGGVSEKKKVQQLCEALIAKYPSSPEARVAATILKNLK
jgi:hypothetical protein